MSNRGERQEMRGVGPRPPFGVRRQSCPATGHPWHLGSGNPCRNDGL